MTEVLIKDSIRTAINQTLTDFFETSIKRATNVDPHYGQLWQSLYDLHSAGGKRIRPTIVMMSYMAFGGKNPEAIIPIASAQELLHFSMLIHDDIIDRDTTRYGVANISGTYKTLYLPFVSNDADRVHYADSAAIMAGDLMIAGAHKLINESTVSDKDKITAHTIMYDSIFDVAGGELLDTETSFRPLGSIDPLKIAQYKTASYSFIGPFLSGACLAGASNEAQDILRDLATNLGIAYQLTDDLLGVFGDDKITGKSNTGDIREGKQTHLISTLLKKLSPSELLFFESSFGKSDATDEAIDAIKSLIITSGARRDSEDLIDSYIFKAKKSLSALMLPSEAHAQFMALINQATKREY